MEEGSEKILGAHLVGPGSVEMLNILAFAIREGRPAAAVRDFISVFPSAASNLFHLVK